MTRSRCLRAASAVLGLLALVAALAPPLAELADERLAAHMGQHLLLVLVAPAFLVAASGRLRQRPLPGRPAVAAALAWLALVGTVWGWHVPALYDLAVAHDPVHGAEHLSLLGAALVYWAVVLRPGHAGVGAAAATANAVVGGALGVLLAFSTAPWYAAYPDVDDQRIAGLVMWVPSMLTHLGVALALFVRWLGGVERRQASAVVGWLLLAVVLAGCGTRLTDETAVVDGEPAAGRVALQEYGCISCHHIPGVASPSGRVGPPLADLADRRTIAGVLPHTPPNLARWIQDPQDVAPGTIMPDVGVTDEDVLDIIAYLYALD